MNKSIISITLSGLVWLAALYPGEAQAQNDSTWLDAGTLKLRRDFTQMIRVKGADLERMPFTNLAEALNVWIYGAYTNSNTLIYVVDGIARQDVNAYSIYDIEEAVFVENALVQINGVSQQQQLVLITTRKHDSGGATGSEPGGHGWTIAAKENVVGVDQAPSGQSLHTRHNTGLYHELYAGLHQGRGMVQYGLSGDFQHDPNPNEDDDSVHVRTPEHMDRVRLNAYVDVRADRYNAFSFRAGYVTMGIRALQEYWSPFNQSGGHTWEYVRQHVFSGSAAWRFSTQKGWTNDLQFSLVTSNQPGSATFGGSTDSANLYNDNLGTEMLTLKEQVDHWLLRDHFAYTLSSGGWQLTPALDISVDHVHAYVSEIQFVSPGSLGGGQTMLNSSTAMESGSMSGVVPSFDAAYGKKFDLHAGALYTASNSRTGWESRRVFPFASLTVGLLGGQGGSGAGSGSMPGASGRSSLKLFGSVAMSPNYLSRDYTLTDFYQSENVLSNNALLVTPYAYSGSAVPQPIGINATDAYWAWSLGARYTSADGGFQADYSLMNNEYPLLLSFGNFLSVKAASHRLGLTWALADSKGLQWQSGLHAAVFQVRNSGNLTASGVYKFIGDPKGATTSWSGGWVNRFTVGRAFFGLDLLYRINEPDIWYPAVLGSGDTKRISALDVQGLYFGLRLPTRAVEVYLDGRNLWQSKHSDLSDFRRYIGVGAKMSL